MEILTYRELERKEELLPLLDHAFGWPFNPGRFEEFAKIDPRLADGAMGFAAVESGHVVGFVGVMDIPTRVLDGSVQCVGGVYGVATLASHVRRHVSTILMERAHEYFREKGYRFSFLFTQRYLVSHGMYEKLGYSDLLERSSAHKILALKRDKAGAKRKEKRVGKLDLDKVLRIYKRCVKDKTGIVLRDRAHMALHKKSDELTGKNCVIGEDGYVFFQKNPSAWVRGTWIRELVALNKREMDKLLVKLEAGAMDLIYDRAVLDERLRDVYRSRGYIVHDRSHGVVMVKPLTKNTSFKQAYGDKFFIAAFDFF